MAKEQDNELYKQLRFKLLNNNIYFKVFKDVVFENSALPVSAGADLILSGIGLENTSDEFTFMSVYREKIEDEAKEDEDFGLVRINIDDIIKNLKEKTIVAYYVNRRSPDIEIETLVRYS